MSAAATAADWRALGVGLVLMVALMGVVYLVLLSIVRERRR